MASGLHCKRLRPHERGSTVVRKSKTAAPLSKVNNDSLTHQLVCESPALSPGQTTGEVSGNLRDARTRSFTFGCLYHQREPRTNHAWPGRTTVQHPPTQRQHHRERCQPSLDASAHPVSAVVVIKETMCGCKVRPAVVKDQCRPTQ